MKAFRLLSSFPKFRSFFWSSFLAGPTGGLAYHVAAFKFRESLWRPFTDDVEEWLVQDWGPRLAAAESAELIIFGPSAGWTLSEKFLLKFSKVICVEPDPLARLLFRWRFRKLPNLQFESRSDLLPWFATDRSPKEIGKNFEALLNRYPSASILFSNLLGQIQLLMEKPNASFNERAQRSFFSGLIDRSWASYHDLASTHLKPKVRTELPAGSDANLNDLVEANFEIDTNHSVTDHETEWLKATKTSVWQIRPGVYHLIGFIDSKTLSASVINQPVDPRSIFVDHPRDTENR